MSEQELQDIIKEIKPLDARAMAQSRRHWDSLAKPLGSLGRLETAVTMIAGIRQTANVYIDRRALIIMCADNGVVAEGISQSGSEVTAAVARNFLEEKSCAAIMCSTSGTDLFPIDIGMAVDVPHLEWQKIAYGTKNMHVEPAMTRTQALAAIEVGIKKVRELKADGYQIIATGEMGIGNTTTSSAIAAVLLNTPVRTVTGRGAGLSLDGLERKIRIIKESIGLHRPNPNDPLDVLAKLGGFDIAGLVGVFLGGAIERIPIVIDGLISSVAALTAVRFAPACADFMLASHVSGEPAAKLLLDALRKEAFLTCDMHLGEGTGAVALFPLLDFAVEIYHQMSPFAEAGFAPYRRFDS